MRKQIGCVYFDTSSKGCSCKHKRKNKWRAYIKINGITYRKYVANRDIGLNWCKIMYEQLSKMENLLKI
jgi:hypothetical protein